ncbi:hypothetical protein FBU59_002777 [Linderina macrospora]|uniref:Uncharacterized protein n=1 Tax=Linderina macrospora TaxID=4868 RepID=A0ACC1JA39_9FUNG|nr:hypothetical protein FBU59_002777 [Linderina macrospora]
MPPRMQLQIDGQDRAQIVPVNVWTQIRVHKPHRRRAQIPLAAIHKQPPNMPHPRFLQPALCLPQHIRHNNRAPIETELE